MDSLTIEIETIWQEMQKINDEIERLKREQYKHHRRIKNLQQKFQQANQKLIRLETIQFEIDLMLEKWGAKND